MPFLPDINQYNKVAPKKKQFKCYYDVQNFQKVEQSQPRQRSLDQEAKIVTTNEDLGYFRARKLSQEQISKSKLIDFRKSPSLSRGSTSQQSSSHNQQSMKKVMKFKTFKDLLMINKITKKPAKQPTRIEPDI